MAIFNSLTFDGENSLDNNIYITGEAVYNAPERDVKRVSVPGRNGDLLIDNGKWNNIEVTYPAGTFGKTQIDYADTVRRYRNILVSKLGYKTLTDTYHPDEYRLGTYKKGLDVDSVQMSSAGEFDLVFDCKPQRYLTSGASSIDITSGETLFNPTLYEASPLIEAEGYGTITIGDYEIEIENSNMGSVVMATGTSSSGAAITASLSSTEALNTGDTITVSGVNAQYKFTRRSSSVMLTGVSNVSGGTVSLTSSSSLTVSITVGDWTLTNGTDATNTSTCSFRVSYTLSGTTYTANVSISVKRTYANNKITWEFSSVSYSASVLSFSSRSLKSGDVVGTSTKSIGGGEVYIDCDLGVCYKIENDEVIDLNSYIDLGSDLPVLTAGNNTITYDGTITSLAIVPRWWIL